MVQLKRQRRCGLGVYLRKTIEYSAAPDIVPSIKNFHDITLMNLSTGIGGASLSTQALHPNPATEQPWIKSAETPLAITAIDASGRLHTLNNFTQRDHTFDVDVTSLPAAITLLRITTNFGTQNLRFIKM